MIELIILLIIIVPRVRGLARERNESAVKWSFAAIGGAIGAELVAGVILVSLWVFLARRGLIPQGNGIFVFYVILSLLLIASAATGATLVIRQLRKKPIIQS
jgi:peptidoglycan biosynthesis protein MviN/MurJ (putative lipid II flippase)